MINNYIATVGDIQRPEREFSTSRTSPATKSTANSEITRSSNSVINTYYKVKNSPIKNEYCSKQSSESFHKKRSKPSPTRSTRLVNQLNNNRN